MALSDCSHCWDTPCTCGWGYRNYNIKGLQERINMLQKVVSFKNQNPQAKFSSIGGEETEDDKKFMIHMNKRG